MNKSDLSQELKLLFLSILLSFFVASDYLIKHPTPVADKKSPPATLRCPTQESDKMKLSLKC